MGYGFNSLTGGYMDSSIPTGKFFASYIQNPSNLIFWIISLLVLAFAVMKGIEKGIEQGIEKGRLEERTEGLRSMVETVKSLVGDDFKKVCEIIKKNKLYENVSEEEIKKFWK